VDTLAIVKAPDLIEQSSTRMRTVIEGNVMNPFVLQVAEESLGRRVVVRRAFGTHK
jgi:hypothetical protein